MSKEKNENTVKKKESRSVLESIRRRTGLLVGIVGLALVIFILESLLGSGASIFGGSEMSTLGTINGKRIDRNEFIIQMENQMNMYRQRNGSNDVPDAIRNQVIEQLWQQYIRDLVIKPQFDKAGIVIGEDELYDRVVVHPAQSIIQNLSDQNGKLNEQFALPDGSLDLIKWKQAVQNVVGDQEMAVRQMEDQVKETRYFEKYRTLVTKGLYVTTAEAKELFKAENTRLNVSYVHKHFDAISDTAVKLSDRDIEKYYKEHSYLYMNPETTRKIEYVSFNVVPSAEDLASLEKEAQEAAESLKGKTFAEDSLIIAQESENGAISVQNFTKKTMIVRDSSIFTSPVGTVFGPYNEGAYFKIYKLEAINSLADSARVRHILIGLNDAQQQPKRSKEQAKTEADSLLTLIKEKKADFEELVKTVSDDGGSIDKGGDYGWFNESTGFVEPYTNAGLMGTKGNISVVETQFGYHIIEVLDVSKTRYTSYKVAQIFKLIAPSDETNQAAYAKASRFNGEHNTAELFDKGVEKEKLTLRAADNIKEGDRQLQNLEQARELVKWVYSAKKGEVGVFSFNDKHIVAKLSGIKNKGVLPLEEVKDQVTFRAKQAKKAELVLAEFANAGKNINEIANKLNIEPRTIELFTRDHNIDGIGHDEVMMGTILGTKQGSTSKAVAGELGAFVVSVNTVGSDASEPKDYREYKAQRERSLSGRSDYEAYNALKELADIEDHKSRLD
ncbi:MAG: peptidylprolyl isomerase [Bacteroidetes bacterium]|nr:peptidylprolyl isomerase [Bacteroidota bacterium]